MEFKVTTYQKEVLGKGSVKTLNLVHGEEEYLVKTLVEKIRDTFGGVRVLWGDEIEPEEVFTSLTEGGLFSGSGGSVCVIFRFDDLVKRVRRRKKTLERFTSDIRKLETVRVFAIVSGKLPPEELSREPYRTFVSHGDIILADRVPRKKILEIVRRKFQREGGGIEEDALELLVDLCGGDLMVLRQEVEKILTYAGKEKITKEVVESVCSPWETGTVFDLIDAVLSRDPERALINLRALERAGIPPLQVQGAVVSYVIRLYTLAVARKRGGDPEKVLDSLGVRHSFARTKMKSYLERVSLQDLRTAVEHLYRNDRAGKVFYTSPEVTLREFILQFTSG
ncbi:MAG: DNA polymerase III subunit delta [Aquificota bacterium]|nr:DNA polymerase III subunit delta [Aquificota bacterium]